MARRLGIDPNRSVFIAGQADLRERNLFERQVLGVAPSAVAAVRHALNVAGLGLDDVAYLDLYSCFPIAVSNIADAFGLPSNGERPLTLIGELPFFGGARNNYSMHAIAEAVDRVRSNAGSHALVSANGRVLSKTSVGIYTARPTELRRDDSGSLQSAIDALTAPPQAAHPDGWATIETYTVIHGRDDERASCSAASKTATPDSSPRSPMATKHC